MRILEVLKKETIICDLKAKEKIGVLKELSMPVSMVANVEHEDMLRVLIEREQLGSTGIGGGIGIPHGKLNQLKSLALVFGISRDGIDFDSMDGRPTHIFFLLVTPENSTGMHLKLLAHISRLLKNDVLKEKLMGARYVDDIYRVIKEEDKEF